MTEKKESMTRRDFIKKAGGLAALGWSVSSLFDEVRAQSETPAPTRSPNERVVIGLIGCGGMGGSDVDDFVRSGMVDVAAVCDVDQNRLNAMVQDLGGTPTPYRDFRKLLERKDIEAVIVATPDHWHPLPTIHACQAGKDVYVEKPLSHNIVEGRAMVNAARRYGRVVQVGTQQRSGAHFQKAAEIVQSGVLGHITLCRAWNVGNESPNGIGNPPDGDPPPEIDYDMWLGPAPKRPYNPNRCHYSFRWFFDYSGGMITDWGTHLLDILLWGMNVEYPTAVSASGGKFVLQDNRDTPDTMEAVYEFPGFVMVYSMRKACGRGMDGRGYGIQFHGTNGTLFVDRGGFEVYPEGDRMQPIPGFDSDQHFPHVLNFLECVKSRERPRSDVEIGHRSTSCPLLGNIALQTGRKIHWDGVNERIIGDEAANRLLAREYRAPWVLPV